MKKKKVFLCGQWRMVRYPKTDAGRECYIKDSLSGTDATPKWLEVIICIVLSPFLLGCIIYEIVRRFAVWLWSYIVRYYYKYMS